MNPHPDINAVRSRTLCLRNREESIHQEPDEIFRSLICSIIHQAVADWRWALRTGFISEIDLWELSAGGLGYRMRLRIGRNLKPEPCNPGSDRPKSIADLVSALRYLQGHGMDFDCDILDIEVTPIRAQLRKEHDDYYEHR